jgi:hypothetical protein
MSETLNDLARTVALARQEEDHLKALVKESDEAYALQTAYMREQLKKASDAARQAEFELRIASLKAWETDGNKHQPGATIRMMKRVLYEAKDAMAWAMEHKMFLKLDDKGFERYAKETPPDFVLVQDEATAAIDSDLSAFLKDGAE